MREMEHMGDYYLIRVYELVAGASATELERLAATGLAEMLRWIPGVKRLSLMRLGADADESTGAAERYVLIMRFGSHEAYMRWRLVEVEGADFWERYASIMIHWEQLSHLVGEYAGEAAVDILFNEE